VEHSPLSVIAAAVEQMTGDPELIPASLVRAAVDVGLDGAAFRAIGEDSVGHRLLEAAGFDVGDEPATSLTAALTDLVLLQGNPSWPGLRRAPARPSCRSRRATSRWESRCRSGWKDGWQPC
jgi:hypothetical protein